MKARLVAVALALAAGSTPAIGLDPQQQGEFHAYLAIEGGNLHERNQDYLGALVRYEAACKIFTCLHTRYPQWDADQVSRHLDDCELKVAELRPLAAFQLAQLHNEWAIDAYTMEGKDAWSALLRAQAKVTYLEVMQINHPELAKAGMGDGMKEADKNVDGMADTMVVKGAQN